MDTPATSPTGQPPKSNKKWIFWGCGGCLVLVVIGFVALGGAAWFGLSKVKDMIVVGEAFVKAQSSPEVQAALGTPIEMGTPSQFDVGTNNGASTAKVTVSLKGPKGSGNLKLDASKAAGQETWVYNVLQVELSDGKVIDLRGPPAP